MTTSSIKEPLAKRVLSSGFGMVLATVVLMWGIEIIDTVLLGSRLEREGIQPRYLDGLDGILWSPFLHLNFAHLISNTAPFLVLGGLVAIGGLRKWLKITAIIMLIGGGLTWLLASSATHIGASGVVFGYFGYLIGAAVFERRFAPLVPAAVAFFLYSGIVFGVIPQTGISWEGHLFGAIGGITAAKILRTKTPPVLRN